MNKTVSRSNDAFYKFDTLNELDVLLSSESLKPNATNIWKFCFNTILAQFIVAAKKKLIMLSTVVNINLIFQKKLNNWETNFIQ